MLQLGLHTVEREAVEAGWQGPQQEEPQVKAGPHLQD